MHRLSKLVNLIGQIRIYSLLDIILLSLAISSSDFQLTGIIFLHLGFLFYLESAHSHKYRAPFPKYLWIIFLVIGIIFYNNITVLGFLICGYLYTKKNISKFGYYAPLLRGLQYYFLASGIIGFLNPISYLVGILLVIRNFTGDLRDISKDNKDKIKTLPILFGLKKDYKYIHLFAILGTTIVWWYLSGISIIWLILILLIQITSYGLTPR